MISLFQHSLDFGLKTKCSFSRILAGAGNMGKSIVVAHWWQVLILS